MNNINVNNLEPWVEAGLTKGEWEDAICLGEYMRPYYDRLVKVVKLAIRMDKIKRWKKLDKRRSSSSYAIRFYNKIKENEINE